VGSKKNPIWRVVVADQRSPRDGRFIEMIGHYNPQTDPSTIVIDEDRFQHWLARGAQPTGTVKQLVKAHSKGLTADPRTSTAPPVPTPQPAAEGPLEDAPIEDAPVEEAPVEDAPVDEAPVDEAPVDEAPVEEAPVEEAPVDEAPVEDAPAAEAPTDAPAEEPDSA
jgi:small subunit ribosomal protein S16